MVPCFRSCWFELSFGHPPRPLTYGENRRPKKFLNTRASAMVYMEQELLQSPKGTTKADAQFCILIDPLGVAVQTVVYYNEQQDNTCFFLDGAC